MLEQTSSSYGGLKLGLFVTKRGLFAQFQRAPFGKSSQKMVTKRYSLRDLASSGHVWTLAIAKVRQNALCCLILIFQRTIWLDFQKGYRRLQAEYPEYPPIPLPNFQLPSSYKNGNCLSIPTSLDILDNIHPRK